MRLYKGETTENMNYSEKNQNTVIGELVYIAYLLCFLAYFCVLFFQNQSLRHVVVFVGSVLNYYIVFRKTSRRHSAVFFLSIFYLIVVMGFGILIKYDGSMFEVVYSSLNFLSLYTLLTTDSSFLMSERLKHFTAYVCILISFVVLLLSRSSVAYLMEDGTISFFLTLGFTNPNLTGMVLFGVFCLLLVNMFQKHRKIQVVPLIILIYLIYLTGSRSALISALFVMMYYLFLSKRKLPDAVVLTVMLIPIVFPLIYVWLFKRIGYATFLGKPLFSGRETMFINFFEILKSYPSILLFGDMNTKFANAHNAPFSVLLTIGLIGTFIVYYNIIRQIIINNRNANTQVSRIAIVGLLGVFLQTSTEGYFMTGVFPGIFIVFVLVSLSKNRSERVVGLR